MWVLWGHLSGEQLIPQTSSSGPRRVRLLQVPRQPVAELGEDPRTPQTKNLVLPLQLALSSLCHMSKKERVIRPICTRTGETLSKSLPVPGIEDILVKESGLWDPTGKA